MTCGDRTQILVAETEKGPREWPANRRRKARNQLAACTQFRDIQPSEPPSTLLTVEPIDLTRYTLASGNNSSSLEATAAPMSLNKRSVPQEPKLGIKN
jgi:hypothetical protein